MLCGPKLHFWLLTNHLDNRLLLAVLVNDLLLLFGLTKGLVVNTVLGSISTYGRFYIDEEIQDDCVSQAI